MKTLIFSLVLMVCAGITNAQEFTELKEAKVESAPLTAELIKDEGTFSYKVQETHIGEFEKDPLSFVKTHFDVRNLITEIDGEQNSYFVTFKSRKGKLQANFNNKGELVSSNSKFKNIILPEVLRHQLYRDHKGWAMVENIHVTRGKDGMVNKDFYKIKLENGNDRKNIILEAPVRDLGVAGN